MRALSILAFPLLLAAALAPISTPVLAQTDIGVAASTRNQVQGVLDGKARTLTAGSDVFANDQVSTSANSLAQLLFLDQTTLSVAPESQVVLNRFIYDPNRGTGSVAMSLTRGAFRFITGTQKSNHYSIETPVATIAVRGTILDILVLPRCTIVILEQGSAEVALRQTTETRDLNHPGTALEACNNGKLEGPFTWDSTIVTINGAVPFPLFGSVMWPGLPAGPINDFDIRKDLNDILNERGSQGTVGPQAPPPVVAPAGPAPGGA